MMKKKVKYAYNKTFFLWIIGSLILFSIADISFTEREIGWGIFMIVVGILALAVAMITPWRYRFDPEGITLCHAFLPNERYRWEHIAAIHEEEASSSSRTTGLDPIFFYVYEITGTPEGKEYFYMQGHVYRSFRTKRLLEQYWDGEIETVWKEMKKSIGGWWRRKVQKKQKAIKQHLTDEIVPLERKVRAEARAVIKPFADQAAQKDLVLHTQFLYITKDQEELHSRPHEGYRYTALVEISRPGEQDEEKIICVSVDLLQVRLGKTAYKGAEKHTACEELQTMLRDTIEDIHEYGI